MSLSRDMLEMCLWFSVRSDAIDAVIVCPYPVRAVMGFAYGHDAGRTDNVVGRGFISHVPEFVDDGWNHHRPFLEEPQPDIALSVFEDGVYLGFVEVETGDVYRQVRYRLFPDVVHFHPVSVGSYVYLILIHAIQGFHGQLRLCGIVDVCEAVCQGIVFEQPVLQASGINVSGFVFADGRRPYYAFFALMAYYFFVFIYAVYSFVIGNDP